jgi:two-component system nitrogen regulation response regulator NtrX
LKHIQILVVDDEEGIRESLKGVLEDEGYSVELAGDATAALAELKRRSYDAVLLDVWMPGKDGLEALEEIQKIPLAERPSVVMISGHGNIETAVRATKLGAFDFLEKPLTIEKVTVTLQNALRQRQLEVEVARLKHASGEDRTILGGSVPMRALRQQLELMAQTNGRVLIYGESGTGKELVAHEIHRLSSRATGPFVEVNCAAIPEDRIESELFGHRKGSFPGALDDKIGKFEKADGGTLFLDEVGDMSLKTQAKVLRALDEGRFQPLGAEETIRADVRVIAATNKNLEDEIERGNFREDLFYRLNVIPFFVPPLRERVEDIRLLAEHFLEVFTTSYARKAKELTPEAYSILDEYPWPGNVRELRNLMERIVIMNPQVRVDARHIPLNATQNGARRAVPEKAAERFGSLQEFREAAEKEFILRKLDETEGNITKTAELLGLERSHLYRKMKALGIVLKEG